MCIFVSPSVIVPNATADDGEVGTDEKVPKSKRALYATAPRSKVSRFIGPEFLTGFIAASIVLVLIFFLQFLPDTDTVKEVI